MRDQIADYLAQGFKQTQVATFCGCTEQYISELVKDESFKELLREKMRVHVKSRIDTRYDLLEENTLKQLNGALETADVTQLTRVLESIARIKSANKVVPVGSLTNPTQGITLVFKSEHIPRLEVDEKNRVISIGDKTMLPMPAKAVKDVFARMEAAILENKDEQASTAHAIAPAPAARTA